MSSFSCTHTSKFLFLDETCSTRQSRTRNRQSKERNKAFHWRQRQHEYMYQVEVLLKSQWRTVNKSKWFGFKKKKTRLWMCGSDLRKEADLLKVQHSELQVE